MKKRSLTLAVILIMVLTASIPVYAGQWMYEDAGWWYLEDDGTYPRNGWLLIDSDWYCFDSNGHMLTGWIQSQNGNCYYCDLSTGAMLKDTWTPDGYYVDANGISTQYAAEWNAQSDKQTNSSSTQNGNNSSSNSGSSSQDPYLAVYEKGFSIVDDVMEIRGIITSFKSVNDIMRNYASTIPIVQRMRRTFDELLTMMEPYPLMNEAYRYIEQAKAALPDELGSSLEDAVEWQRSLNNMLRNYNSFLDAMDDVFRQLLGR